ncbi:MAG: hypothetical protein RLZZ142_2836 [Verrucomicrobiota bacterium]
MKSLQSSLLVVCGVLALSAGGSRADIHDPYLMDQNPIRKLSRGLSNVTFGATEIPVTWHSVNVRHGNAAAFSYGLVSGVGRTLARLGAGIYDIVTFPIPSNRGSYSPILPSATPWVHNGFEEFPPELGFESRLDYSRSYAGFSRLP